MATTVTCTKRCRFYINDEKQDDYNITETGLIPGLTYTPSAPSHMPDYDESVYTEYEIRYGDTDYTTGSFVCPDEDFKLYYSFYGYTDNQWKLGSVYTLSYISGAQSKGLSFGTAGRVARIQLSFSEEGKAVFYTSGSLDTYGYLSTSSTLDPDEGGPASGIEGFDDDSGDSRNFQITCTVYPDIIYYLWVRPYSIDATGTTTVYIKAPGTSVKLWSWTSSNGDASAAQTRAAHTAVRTQGPVADFSYFVWNDLVSKVRETLTAVGASWDTSYLSLSRTKMNSSDKTLTADRFNSLCYNIDLYQPTGIDEVSPGEKVYGRYFLTIAEKINDWITADT